MVKKVLKKLGKGLKKAAPLIAAGLGAAALAKRARAKNMQNSMTADMPRSMVPMDDRMVQGLNFPAGTDLSGIKELAKVGKIDLLKKGGRVGCGKAKRGFGRAMKRRK
jgi:hypothetical protein